MGSSGYKVEANHSLGSGLLMDRGPHRSPKTRWRRHKEVEEFFVDSVESPHTGQRANQHPASPSLLSPGSCTHAGLSIITDMPSEPAASTLCSLNKG